jgi:hypothetical protein
MVRRQKFSQLIKEIMDYYDHTDPSQNRMYVYAVAWRALMIYFNWVSSSLLVAVLCDHAPASSPYFVSCSCTPNA